MGFPTRIGQAIYGALILISVVLVLASIFTPGWREFTTQQTQYQYQQPQSQTTNYNAWQPSVNMGLFQFACWSSTQNTMYSVNNNQYGGYGSNPFGGTGGYNTPSPSDLCYQWWRAQPGYEKTVIAMTIIVVLVSIIAFLWNFVTFCSCGPKEPEHRPLIAFSLVSAVLLIIALIIYGTNNSNALTDLSYINGNVASGQIFLSGLPNLTTYVAYSYYLACVAAVALTASTVVAILVVCCDANSSS